MSDLTEQPRPKSTWTRPPARLPRVVEFEPRVRSIFYSYPPELIAQWCSVSVSTARAWKEGKRKPTRQAVKLFRLYADEQVLTPAFRGFIVRKDRLVDRAGMTLTPSQIEGYNMMVQFAAELARRSSDPKDREQYALLLRLVA